MEELMELAIDNTQKLQPFKIETTLEARFRLFEKYFDFNVSEHINLLDYKEETNYVLSNKNIILGAVCMLYKDTLRNFANSIESDLIIVPAIVDVIYF